MQNMGGLQGKTEALRIELGQIDCTLSLPGAAKGTLLLLYVGLIPPKGELIATGSEIQNALGHCCWEFLESSAGALSHVNIMRLLSSTG
jgi:hypothetical protein